MSDFVGYGTGFYNPDADNEWENSPGVNRVESKVLADVFEAVKSLGYNTKEAFELADPLYLTEIRVVRQLTWDDIKGID